MLRSWIQTPAAQGIQMALSGLCLTSHGVGETVLAVLRTDCSQHCPWDIHLPGLWSPGQSPSKVQDSGHGWGDGTRQGLPVVVVVGWVTETGLTCPLSFERFVPGRQGWVGTRVFLGPPPALDMVQPAVQVGLCECCSL